MGVFVEILQNQNSIFAAMLGLLFINTALNIVKMGAKSVLFLIDKRVKKDKKEK